MATEDTGGDVITLDDPIIGARAIVQKILELRDRYSALTPASREGWDDPENVRRWREYKAQEEALGAELRPYSLCECFGFSYQGTLFTFSDDGRFIVSGHVQLD